MADRWFTGMVKALLRCQEAVSLWVLAAMEGFVTGIFIGVMKKVIFAAFTCIFALGMCRNYSSSFHLIIVIRIHCFLQEGLQWALL